MINLEKLGYLPNNFQYFQMKNKKPICPSCIFVMKKKNQWRLKS